MCIVVVDESDSIMLDDPITFFKQVKNPRIQVICLTATPDDGYIEGAERTLINLMGFKRIRTSRKSEVQVPQITQHASFGAAEDVIKVVEERRLYQGVLIYANEPLYTELKEHEHVKAVTMDTPDEDLRRMDKQVGSGYPVYLANDTYGIRGLDYRAPNNKHGICMLIVSSFRDKRT